MTNQNTRADVVIIGGGLAGLTAANYLARAGKAVTLYEKAAELGGRASTQMHDQFRFNRGIHALYCGGAAEAVLKELDIRYTGGSPKGIYGLKSGKLHIAPVGMMSMLQTGLLSFADKLELMRVFSLIPKLDHRDYGHMTVQAWIDQNAKRPAVRQLLEANARTFVYSAALAVASADVFIQKMQLAAKHPIIYIDGGWQTLVEGLRQKAIQAGVKIVTHARVDTIQYAGGRVTGVRLSDGSTQAASAVIVATAPQDAVKLVDEVMYPGFGAKVAAIVPAQLACLDVALSRLPKPQYPVVQDMEQPHFLSTQSVFSKVAPDGGALIYAFKQLDPTKPSDPREDERDLEGLLDTVQPGWREVIVKREYLPRILGVGMLPTANDGGFEGRPKAQATGVKGVYVVGDWVGGEGFLSDACFASARDVARGIA